MSDEKLIHIIAQYWISNGGDSTGMLYSWHKIVEEIRKLENENAIRSKDSWMCKPCFIKRYDPQDEEDCERIKKEINF